jgi:hypothetical protein
LAHHSQRVHFLLRASQSEPHLAPGRSVPAGDIEGLNISRVGKSASHNQVALEILQGVDFTFGTANSSAQRMPLRTVPNSHAAGGNPANETEVATYINQLIDDFNRAHWGVRLAKGNPGASVITSQIIRRRATNAGERSACENCARRLDDREHFAVGQRQAEPIVPGSGRLSLCMGLGLGLQNDRGV